MTDINDMSYSEAERKAALGDAEALLNLGVRLWEGEGTAKDTARAMECIKAAGEKENAQANYILGMIYLGDDEYMDIKKAVACFEEASRLNFAPAMTELAVMLLNGDGAKKDEQRAAMLLSMAEKLGDERASVLLDSTDDGSFDGGKKFSGVDDILNRSSDFCSKVFCKRLFGRERNFDEWYGKYGIAVRTGYLYLNFRTSDEFNREKFQEALNTLAVKEVKRLNLEKTDEEVELRKRIINVYRNSDTLFNNFYNLGMIKSYSDAVNICLSLLMDSIPEDEHHKEEKTIMTELRKIFYE